MGNKMSKLLAMLLLLVFAFLPNTGFVQTQGFLSQQEIDSLLNDNDVMSPTRRVTTLDEMNIIENYYEENPNAMEENIEEILEKLNLEQVEIIPSEKINELNTVKKIQTRSIAALGSVVFRDVSHNDTLFYATLYARNMGIGSIDQIGGRVYGYAMLPNTNYSTIVLNNFFNETHIKPFLDRKIGSYNIAHYKNKASFMADYVVKDGKTVLRPSPAGVEFNGIK